MAPISGPRSERLQVRIDAETKNLLRRAARCRHKTVSRFLLATAVAEAEKVIRENETVTLSSPDWETFYDALIDPPAPNAALRDAFAKYEQTADDRGLWAVADRPA
ncbi:type II toxin-antitoxin system TacA family antitoxin [Pseudochelatococcus sp. B33]